MIMIVFYQYVKGKEMIGRCSFGNETKVYIQIKLVSGGVISTPGETEAVVVLSTEEKR